MKQEKTWTFGRLIGPVLDDQNGGLKSVLFLSPYRCGAELTYAVFVVSAESRDKLSDFATADGVDGLIRELILIEQSDRQQKNWQPGVMLLSFEYLKGLFDRREQALINDQKSTVEAEQSI